MSNEYVRMKKSTMDSIAKAIQEKEGSTDPIPGAEMPARIGAIGGVNYLAAAKTYTVASLNDFGQKVVIIDLPKATSLAEFCNVTETVNVNTTLEELTINCPNPINSIYAILSCGNSKAYADYTLRKVTLNVDTSAATLCSMAFSRLKALEAIEGTPLDFSAASAIGGAFAQCTSLREVRFKGWIKKSVDIKDCPLSKASILNIFSCLYPEESGMTFTLKKEAVDKAFETSPGAADGSTSAEWLALVAEHSNCTISLV